MTSLFRTEMRAAPPSRRHSRSGSYEASRDAFDRTVHVPRREPRREHMAASHSHDALFAPMTESRRVRGAGLSVAHVHLRHLNPFPDNTGEVLARYERVIVPEMNLGQLAMLLRAKYLVDVRSHTSVRGLPFRIADLVEVITGALDATAEQAQTEARA